MAEETLSGFIATAAYDPEFAKKHAINQTAARTLHEADQQKSESLEELRD